MQIEARIDLSALVDFLLCVCDCSPDYEEDEFGVEFQGVRCYVERHVDCFRVEVGHEDDVVHLPRP